MIAVTDADSRAAVTLALGDVRGEHRHRNSARPCPSHLHRHCPSHARLRRRRRTGFFLFADAFGSSDPCFDLDGSGSVDFAAFFLLADYFAGPEARGKLLALARDILGLVASHQLWYPQCQGQPLRGTPAHGAGYPAQAEAQHPRLSPDGLSRRRASATGVFAAASNPLGSLVSTTTIPRLGLISQGTERLRSESLSR